VGGGLGGSRPGRMTACRRRGALAARLGGEEFGVLLTHTPGVDDAAIVARKLLAELSEPIHFRSQLTAIRCSIGIASFPGDTRDPEQLIRKADTALYHAKGSGGGSFAVYRDEMGAAAQKSFALEEQLRTALD